MRPEHADQFDKKVIKKVPISEPDPCKVCFEFRKLGTCQTIPQEHCAACHRSVCGEDMKGDWDE